MMEPTATSPAATFPPPPAPTSPSSSVGTPPTTGRSRPGWFARAYGPLVQARTWKATLMLLLGLPLGIAWFTVAVTLLSVSAGLMVTFIGLPLLAGAVQFGRGVGAAERARARSLMDADLPAFPRRHGRGDGFIKRMTGLIADGAGWRGIAYSFVALPWGILTFTLAVVIWSVSLSAAAWPIYTYWIPETDTGGPYRFGDHYVLHGWGRFGYGAGVTVLGLVMLIAAPRLVRGLAKADRAIIRGLLSPNPNKLLEQRVSELTVSRDASVEGASTELRRIERDLHDGAQQRLVAVAMDLGIARERLASGGDPERAMEVVTRAHEEAKAAITDLRNLVRGIHPSILTDRGLDAALSALAARSPIPIAVDVDLVRRPPAAVEAAAYFVVAEALANIAKHSRATRGSVRIGERADTLLIEIYDDGVGGATEHPGGGLSGLRDRVVAVEGRLRISSPAGGPTAIAVELPCAS